MDLGRRGFPSPAVTYANQLNVVTTCLSSTCVSSSIAQPAKTSVHATASICCIRPNFVKSRAQVFEGKDADVTKVLVPAKTVIRGNCHAKTDASPSHVNVTVGSRRLVVRQSKSVGDLEHTQVSPIKLKDKTTRFMFDMDRSPEHQNPPSPVRRNFHAVHSVAVSELVSSEMQSDVVAQRLKLFENKPVLPNKPALLPKPRSPRSEFVANRVSVYRSRSSDSVSPSEVDCVSHHDSAQRIANINSETPTDDAGAKTRNAVRQVKEIVVVNPPSSSCTETSKIVSPILREKPQVKEVVGRPPSFSRKVKETVTVSSTPSSSSSETSKIVFQQAPKKPPRMTVANPPSVTTTRDDSYGLLVYAAGAATPSVHVEKLNPVVTVVDDQSLQKISDARVADRRSHLSRDRQQPTCSVSEAVFNASRLRSNNSFKSSVALQPSSVNDAWDNKFIRAPKNTPVVHSKGKKENFVTKKRMNNPNYMYVSVHMDDVIPSRKKVVKDKQTLTRHHSDDMLNIPRAPRHSGMPAPKSPGYKEPLYSVPFEFACNATDNSVKFDSAGYALPNVQYTPQFKVTNLLFLNSVIYILNIIQKHGCKCSVQI